MVPTFGPDFPASFPNRPLPAPLRLLYLPMATDFQSQKTDDQLRFIFNNPAHYHADIVQAAGQELRRRGAPIVLPGPAVAAAVVAAAAPSPILAAETSPSAAPPRTGPVYQPITYQSPPEPEPGPLRKYLGLGLLALLLLAGGFYWFARTPTPSPVAVAHRPPPRLVEVATTPLPNSDANVARCVEQQTARLPAAERTEGQHLRQYRELARRFWAAETLTEYLIEAAQTAKTTPAFDQQVLLAHDAWAQWAKARVYGYRFGPGMAGHLDRMTRAATQQTQVLADLPADVAAARAATANGSPPAADPKSQQRAADVADLLRGLLPKSPVTGRVYPAINRRISL